MLKQQYRYEAKYKPNQLITGTGQTAIITGWTVKSTIAKKLDSEQYAVIGQLYSPTRGISLLIRNLILNPHVRYLVGLNATKEDKNTGAVQCLIDFFEDGYAKGISDTGKPCWVIASNIPGYIDLEISADVLDRLREAIHCVHVTSSSALLEAVKSLAHFNLQPWGTPQDFPMEVVTPTVFPGTRYGHRIEGKTIAETWVKIIHRIKTTGTIRPTGYDGHWQELIDLMAVVTDEPDNFYFPEPNYLPCDRVFIESYIPQVLDDAPYHEGVKYTYGQRLRSWFKRDQIEQVIQKLIGEIDAASAVMSLWDVQDHEKGGSPCLNHIWVRVVDNEMSLTAIFRSNDMFSAWVANAMGLRALQKHILEQINLRGEFQLRIGPLITISQSAHIYDDTWENADKLIERQYQQIVQQEQRQYDDPVGSFLIERKGDRLLVQHITPGSGEVVGCYEGKDPLKLSREIIASNPGIKPDHASYLGIELALAATSVNYEQDKNA